MRYLRLLCCFVLLSLIPVVSIGSPAAGQDADDDALRSQCVEYVSRGFVEASEMVTNGDIGSVEEIMRFSSEETAVVGSDELQHLCDVLPVYYVGQDTGAAGRLRQRALDAHPSWVVQGRVGDPQLTNPGRSRGWLAGTPWEDGPEEQVYPNDPAYNNLYSEGCVTQPGGFQCDEFPNATMVKGGNPETYGHPFQPALSYIQGRENGSEGGKWSAFLSACSIVQYPREATLETINVEDLFLVVPVEGLGYNTVTDSCGGPDNPVDPENPDPETPDPENPDGSSLPEPPVDDRPEPPLLSNPMGSGTCTTYSVDNDRQVIGSDLVKGSLKTDSRTGAFFTWNADNAADADYIAIERFAEPGQPVFGRTTTNPRVVSTFVWRASTSGWFIKLYDSNDELLEAIPCDPSDGLDDLLDEHPVPDYDCTHLGTAEAERIDGTSGNDTICPLGGDDVVNGLDGNDTIVDFAGNNRLNGDSGNDLIQTGPGADIIEGSDGDDYLSGGDGNDILRGNEGDDRLSDGPGNDFIYGDSGADIAREFVGLNEPSSGNDTYYMGDGQDLVNEPVEDSGDDALFMGNGTEYGYAGSGDDYLHAEPDFLSDAIADRQDRLDGGPGDDVLVHISPAEAVGPIGPVLGATLIGGTGGDLFLTLDASWDSIYFEEVGGISVDVPAGPCEVTISANAPDEDEVIEEVGVSCDVYGTSIGITFTSTDGEITNVDPTIEALEQAWALYKTIQSELNNQPQPAVDTCVCDQPIIVKDITVVDDPITDI